MCRPSLSGPRLPGSWLIDAIPLIVQSGVQAGDTAGFVLLSNTIQLVKINLITIGSLVENTMRPLFDTDY
jgi:hypothetical protein